MPGTLASLRARSYDRVMGRTSRRTVLAAFVLAVAALAAGASAQDPATRKRPPNVVFVLADDLGYRELGCFGQQKIRTPRIDAIAADGMRLLRPYSGSPVCAPSRSVLMSGKHPGHAAVRNK